MNWYKISTALSNFSPDASLIYEAQTKSTGANIHKINNMLQGYLNLLDLAKMTFDRGDIDKSNKFLARAKRIEVSLRELTSQGQDKTIRESLVPYFKEYDNF